jgi:hypothetical protein
LPELGNVFLEYEDWRERYAAFIQCAGHLLISCLDGLEPPVFRPWRLPPRACLTAVRPSALHL